MQGSVAPPIQLSTTFEHGPAGERLHGYEYVREGNPNVDDLQSRLAAIDNADGAIAFGSGMAAAAAVLSRLAPGARVIFHKDLYFDIRKLSNRYLPNWGLRCDSVDLTDSQARKNALSDKADLVWFETPSNPQLDVINIEAVCQEAREIGADVLVDGTFATPALQKPLEHGASFVLHSLTKYIGGHSDVQGGAIAYRGDPAIAEGLAEARRLMGGVLSPFNAWLLSRGLQTLHCRMEKHCTNALAVAEALDSQEKVSRVRYPFLPSNPACNIARQQMSAGGGMISFEVVGGREAALQVASNVRLFVNATSLGGVESLIEHRASVEGLETASPSGLLRLSIGLENAQDLIDDLLAALSA